MTLVEPVNLPAGATDLDAWKTTLTGRKFVWLLAPPWDGVWTRQVHFARRMAQLGAEVLYVENPCAWTSALKQRNWRALPAGGNGRVREVEPQLHVMSPGLSLPGSMRSEFIARLNGRFLAAQVSRWLAARPWSDYTAWCRLPHSVATLENLRPALTVYDVTDDYELFESHPGARRLVRRRESQLAARAGLVLVTAPELQNTERLRRTRSCCVPNGVDYELFAQAGQPGLVHPRVSEMRQPVIGCVGLTSPWTDFELLEMLARRWPGQVLMVGPVAAAVEARARALRGVEWAGMFPQPQLVPWLRGFAVCLMPYLVNERTRKASPLKLWEYAATGKPIVAVDLPAFAAAREFVDVAHSRQHFVELVARRLQGGPKAPPEVAQAAARNFSWDEIFHRLMRELGPRLEGITE